MLESDQKMRGRFAYWTKDKVLYKERLQINKRGQISNRKVGKEQKQLRILYATE